MMVTATNTLTNSKTGSLDFLARTSKMSCSDNVISEISKIDNAKVSSKSKNDDFKEVLNSKVSYKDDDTKRIQNRDDSKEDISKLDELKEELKKLEEESKSDSKDDVQEMLNQLLNLLAKLGIDVEKLKQKGQISSDALKNLLESIKENSSSSSTMEKLLELMKNDSVKDALDADSLKYMEKILNNLSSKIADDNTQNAKDIKSSIKNLMSEISNVLDSKQNAKVLTLEEMLKNNSQDSKDGSLGNESNKEASKEDKFLNSLLNDNKDDSLNKINLFASRSQVIQNQSGDTVRGLTINKATFANDLIRDVKFMSTNAIKELTVKVNPGNLGEITIKLIQEDGLMKANLKANSKEATAILSQNLTEIKKQLTEQNIKIADVKVEIYQGDTTFFNEQNFGGQLSEEQRKSSNNSSNVVSNEITTDEELNNNNASNDRQLEIFA